MTDPESGFATALKVALPEVREHVTATPSDEGFGVLTGIDALVRLATRRQSGVVSRPGSRKVKS